MTDKARPSSSPLQQPSEQSRYQAMEYKPSSDRFSLERTKHYHKINPQFSPQGQRRTSQTASTLGYSAIKYPSQTEKLHLSRSDMASLRDPLENQSYLNYAPLASTQRPNYTAFLDQLGFRPEHQSANARALFVKHLQAHVDPYHYKFLRREDNEKAFKTMTMEFLRVHGSTHWGSSDRHHLQERDILKGYLCPRDAEREGSRLVEVLESMFEYKSENAHKNETKKSENCQVAHLIEFKEMTGFLADAKPLPATNPRVAAPKSQRESSVPRKRLEKQYEGPYNFLDVEEMPTSLRPRSESSKWTRIIAQDDDAKDNLKKRASRDGIDTSSSPAKGAGNASTNKRRYTAVSTATEDSSSDSDVPLSTQHASNNRYTVATTGVSPITHRAKKHRPAPATMKTPSTTQQVTEQRPTPATTDGPISQTRTPSFAPTRAQNSVIISIESASEGEEVNVKTEPLSGPALTKTTILASASHENKAPILVPLKSCRTPGQLFATLIKELEIHQDLAEDIKQISVTYTWTGKRLRIRKGNASEWQHFCKTVRTAWESSGKKPFPDGCEVEMVVHVDD